MYCWSPYEVNMLSLRYRRHGFNVTALFTQNVDVLTNRVAIFIGRKKLSSQNRANPNIDCSNFVDS